MLVAMLFSASCGSSSSLSRSERKAQEEAEKAAYIKAIKERNFDLDITQIIPKGFPSTISTGEYYMTVRGDVVNTRLPFRGSINTTMIDGQELSIVFDDMKVEMRSDFSDEKSGEFRYQFAGKPSDGSWVVTLQLYDNGKAHIGCQSASRGSMSYIANIIIPEK